MQRTTRVVSGPLALKMQRLAGAREGVIGLEIVSLPQLAARLAGGFARPTTTEDLQPAIRIALDYDGYNDIRNLTRLPAISAERFPSVGAPTTRGCSCPCQASSKLGPASSNGALEGSLRQITAELTADGMTLSHVDVRRVLEQEATRPSRPAASAP